MSLNALNSFQRICQKSHPYLSSAAFLMTCQLTDWWGLSSISSEELETTWSAKGTAGVIRCLTPVFHTVPLFATLEAAPLRLRQGSIHDKIRDGWKGAIMKGVSGSKTGLAPHHSHLLERSVSGKSPLAGGGSGNETAPHTRLPEWAPGLKSTAPRHAGRSPGHHPAETS